MPSATEARFLTGLDDLQAAGQAFLAQGARNVIIKNGRGGSPLLLGGEPAPLTPLPP
jgi:sugar/nucleoside kinase (ribokinase family)